MLKKIELGNYCKDKITGIEGTVIYLVYSKYQAPKVGLQPAGVTRDGKMIDSEWFDINQIQYLREGDVVPTECGKPLFNYGDKVKDEITSFEGIVFGFSIHINGCIRYDVAPIELKDGLPQTSISYDQARLKLAEKVETNVKPPPTNGPMDMGRELSSKPSK